MRLPFFTLLFIAASTLVVPALATSALAGNLVSCDVVSYCPPQDICATMGFQFKPDGSNLKATPHFQKATILARQMLGGYLVITGYESKDLYFARIHVSHGQGLYRTAAGVDKQIVCH